MKDVFQVVTDRIMSQLQKGVIPWQRTWSSNGPTSYQTNKEYQGINALILQDTYKSPYWLTVNTGRNPALQGGRKAISSYRNLYIT